MPFGWSLSPYLCTKFLKPLIKKLQAQFEDCTIAAYLDDFLIMGPDRNRTQAAINATYALLKEAGLTVNEDKSHTSPQESVEWLGFIYSKGTLS